VLIRPSGTEPVLRVMVEASEAKIAEAMAQRLASTIRPAVN
jgi:phosphoglucosamine mutase